MKTGHVNKGFTLIELLTVIALIGILAGILIPTTSAVRNSAKKAKTQTQFKQWAAGFTLFKNEYGYYPILRGNKINGSGVTRNSTTIADDDKLFRELLSGRTTNTSGSDFLSSEKNLTTGTPRTQNKKRMNFYSFAEDEITSTAKGDKLDGAVRDAFGNVEIAVIFDRNSDGLITNDEKDAANADAFSDIYSSEETGNFVDDAAIKASITAAGIRQGVIFYSAGNGKASSGSNVLLKDAVLSWE